MDLRHNFLYWALGKPRTPRSKEYSLVYTLQATENLMNIVWGGVARKKVCENRKLQLSVSVLNL